MNASSALSGRYALFPVYENDHFFVYKNERQLRTQWALRAFGARVGRSGMTAYVIRHTCIRRTAYVIRHTCIRHTSYVTPAYGVRHTAYVTPAYGIRHTSYVTPAYALLEQEWPLAVFCCVPYYDVHRYTCIRHTAYGIRHACIRAGRLLLCSVL